MGNALYSFYRVLEGKKEGSLSSLSKIGYKEAFDVLVKNQSLMKGQYLGACLDKCRAGSMTTCLWPTDVRGLMGVIQQWRDVNCDNEALYHEMPLSELYTKFELPRINHDVCPNDPKHFGTFKDVGGRTRCGHRKIQEMSLGLIEEGAPYKDSLTQTLVRYLGERVPRTRKDGEMADTEEPVEVLDICYSIIKEPENLKLSFENILRRLNIYPEFKTSFCGRDSLGPCARLNELDDFSKESSKLSGSCIGHKDKTNKTEFTFDGWDLAYYLRVWKEQGNAPWFAIEKEVWPSREHLRICSD